MLITFDFLKIIDNKISKEIVCSFSYIVKNKKECSLHSIMASQNFRKKIKEEGKYIISVKHSGKKVYGFDKWMKILDKILYIDHRSFKYNVGEQVSFPKNCNCSRRGQVSVVEFIDDVGVGLMFLHDKSNINTEFYEFQELEDLDIL